MSDTAQKEEGKVAQFTIGGTIAMVLLALIGIFIHSWLASSTLAFLSDGVVWGLMVTFAVAVIVVPILLTIHFSLWAIRRKWTLPNWLNDRNLYRVGAGGILLGIVTGLYGTIPKVRYQRHIDRHRFRPDFRDES